MALPASDNFNRSNGSIGSNWTTITGENALVIASNHAAGSADPSGMYWSADAFGSDQYCQASLVSTNDYVSILCRVSPSQQTYYGLNIEHAGWYFLKYVNGVGSLIGSFQSRSIVNGDVWRLEAVGSTLRVSVNGALLSYSVDDASVASGSPGIEIDTGSSAYGWDNWGCGNVGGGFLPTWIRAISGSIGGR